MKKLLLIIPVGILFLMVGCGSRSEDSSVSIKELAITDGYEVIITDTIYIDMQTISFHLMEYNSEWESFVAYDAGLKLLMEFNQDYQLKKSIDLSQDGPNSYGPQCYGLTYYQDSLLAVSGLNGFFIYNQNWELVSKFSRPENTFPNVQSNWEIFTIKGDNGKDKIISSYVDETSKSSLEEFEPLAVVSFNESTKESELNFFGGMDSRSIYRNSSKNYPTNEVMFTYNSTKEHIYKINRLESILYLYNKKGELQSLLDFKPEDFTDPFEVDPELTGSALMQAESKNDRLMAIYTEDDLIAVSYFTGTGADGTQSLKPHVQFIFDEKIKSNDIELQSPLRSVAKILPNRKLLFYGSHPKANESSTIQHDGTYFYKADLVKVK
jgi:hypothetical protein